MRERPILFNGEMVRAILEGRKTQTRRPVKHENAPSPGFAWAECLCCDIDPADRPCITCECRFGDSPYGVPGDRLYVRENGHVGTSHASDAYPKVHYQADMICHDHDGRSVCPLPNGPSTYAGPWTPSILMPKWASRLWLRVTDVRVDRVWDMTESEALREGFTSEHHHSATHAFADAWPYREAMSWQGNPLVWVVSFEREANQ